MELKECEWLGSECGHHAAYIFYKGFKYLAANHPKWKIVSIGQFLFVRIWGESDLVSVAEVQLLWEDKSTGQKMCSVRLYFLPEFTSEGRLPHHGEDEMVAVAEKAVLRVVDLLDWVVPKHSLNWERGAKGIAAKDCPNLPTEISEAKNGVNNKLDLSEIDQARLEIGDPEIEEQGIVILSAPNYCRYRALLKRLEGVEEEWIRNNLIVALGGFTTLTRNTAVMFAKEIFDYPELEEHPQLSNHLAPKMKGRPRKKQARSVADEEGSPPADPDSSPNCDKVSNGREFRNGTRKELVASLAQSHTQEETHFLNKLTRFLDQKGISIDKAPTLGFKQIGLYDLYLSVDEVGGYEECMSSKAWKQVYDDLGGAPTNSSAATVTRRLYERYLLPYERHLNSSTKKNDRHVVNDVKHAVNDRQEDPVTVDLSGDDSEKVEITLDENSGLRPEDMKPDSAGGLDGKSASSETENSVEEVKTGGEKKGGESVTSTPTKEPKQYLGLKPLQLLTEPKETSPAESPASVVDARLDLSQLILPPLGGSLEDATGGGAGGPATGSALQNLAKIASRYSKDKSRTQDFLSPGSKRQRLIDSPTPGVVQPLPPSPASSTGGGGLSAGNSLAAAAALAMAGGDTSGSGSAAGITASALLQQFSLMSPLFSAGLSNSGGGATSQEGYNLLKYYEQQLKLLQQSSSSSGSSSSGAAASQAAAASLNPSSSSVNNKKDSSLSSSSPHHQEKKDSANKIAKEKNKVNKPPPDTVKPPRLLQNPCQFLQTSTIYGSPKSDLDKMKENALKSGALGASGNGGILGAGATPNQVLDLSSGTGGSMEFRTVSPHHRSSLGMLSISSTPSTTASDSLSKRAGGVAGMRTTPTSSQDNGIDLRLTPNRTSTSSSPSPYSHQYQAQQAAKSFSAEALIGNSRSSPGSGQMKQPTGSSSGLIRDVGGGSSSPVKRSTPSTPVSSWLPGLTSSSPGMGRSTTPATSASLSLSSLSSLSPAALQQLSSTSSSSSAAAAAAASNAAYLQALMMNPKAAASLSAAGGGSSASRMDPLSQYYAMLYSQQLAAAAAYNPYAAAAALGGGMPHSSPRGGSSGAGGLSSASQFGIPSSSSAAAAAAAAASFPGLFGAAASTSGGGSAAASTADILNALSAASGGSSSGQSSAMTSAAMAALGLHGLQPPSIPGLPSSVAVSLGSSSSSPAGLSAASLAASLGAGGGVGGSSLAAASMMSLPGGGAAGSGGGGAAASAAAELQLLQAYQDLLTRSGAMPPTSAGSAAASMFNIGGLLGAPPNLGPRKE